MLLLFHEYIEIAAPEPRDSEVTLPSPLNTFRPFPLAPMVWVARTVKGSTRPPDPVQLISMNGSVEATTKCHCRVDIALPPIGLLLKPQTEGTSYKRRAALSSN